MDSLSSAQMAAALAVVAVAYVVRGMAGFGSGLIATPLLLLMLPLTIAVPLVVVLDYAASAMQGISDRRTIVWREIVCILPTATIGVIAAFWLFRTVDSRWLVKGLAVVLVVIAIYQLRTSSTKKRISEAWAIPAGAFGGLIGTLFGTGGPFYVAYLNGRQLDKLAFRATFSTIFLADGANRIASYALSGFLDARFFNILLWLVPMMMGGILVGRRLHTNIGPTAFRRGISGLLLVSAGLLLMR